MNSKFDKGRTSRSGVTSARGTYSSEAIVRGRLETARSSGEKRIQEQGLLTVVLSASGVLLIAATWVSAILFGAYILIFFGGTALQGQGERWNEALKGLRDARSTMGTPAIAAHFATGGILLLLGPVQLVGRVRRAYPAIHRWLGRLYVLSAALAGAGGLVFIVANGTIGGAPMDVGFGIYGALMVLAAERTFVHAWTGQVEAHRSWATRLFALTVGSWLYRMEYGLWLLVVGRAGHTPDFRGTFDVLMTVLFYLPNLVIAELFIRGRVSSGGVVARAAGAVAMLGASAFVMVATWVFTTRYWWPGIATGLGLQ